MRIGLIWVKKLIWTLFEDHKIGVLDLEFGSKSKFIMQWYLIFFTVLKFCQLFNENKRAYPKNIGSCMPSATLFIVSRATNYALHVYILLLTCTVM